MHPLPLLLVGLGGSLGAIARYGIGLALTRRLGPGFPWATFVINVTGCFAIALFLTFAGERMPVREGWRHFFPIGFVGGFTTFSSYAWEVVQLAEAGAWGRALAYALGSTAAGVAAVVLAMWIVRR